MHYSGDSLASSMYKNRDLNNPLLQMHNIMLSISSSHSVYYLPLDIQLFILLLQLYTTSALNIERLVVSSGSLASLQLLKIPRTSLHVSLVLIQALGELLSINITVTCLPVVLLWCGLGVGDLGLWGSSWGGTATKETTDGVADG